MAEERIIDETNERPEVVKITPDDVEPVVKHAKVRQKTMFERMADSFALDWDDTVHDVIVPGLLDMGADIMHGIIDNIFDTRGGRSRSRYSSRRRSRRYDPDDRYYDYDDDYDPRYRRRSRRSFWDEDDDDRRRERRRRSRRSDDFRFIGDMDRRERDALFRKCERWFEDYTSGLPIAKVKYWAGLDNSVITTDNYWGWYDIRDMRCCTDPDGGYGIEFEPPVPID